MTARDTLVAAILEYRRAELAVDADTTTATWLRWIEAKRAVRALGARLEAEIARKTCAVCGGTGTRDGAVAPNANVLRACIHCDDGSVRP